MYSIGEEKMNTEQQEKPKITEAKRRANRKYYQKRYSNDEQFRDKESKRVSKNVMKNYNNNPEIRERMKANALARYYRLKEENAAQAKK
jgi:type II secretory pathway component HofQ